MRHTHDEASTTLVKTAAATYSAWCLENEGGKNVQCVEYQRYVFGLPHSLTTPNYTLVASICTFVEDIFYCLHFKLSVE